MLLCFARDVNQFYQDAALNVLCFEVAFYRNMSGVHLETSAPRILTGPKQMRDAGLPFGSEFIAA